MPKTARQLERYFKGAANHYRIEILVLVDRNQGMTLEGITENLNANVKTISEHTKKLVAAGLLNKKYRGKYVTHELSPYGKRFLEFMRSFN